jgi:hypothetical protein
MLNLFIRSTNTQRPINPITSHQRLYPFLRPKMVKKTLFRSQTLVFVREMVLKSEV